METSEFLVHCQLLLDEEKPSDVIKLIEDKDNEEIITYVGWQLVGLLCQQLTKYTDKEKLDNVEKGLIDLIQKCSAKEVMLGLGEQLATHCSERSFAIIMRLCKQAIVKLKRRQSKYLINFCKHFVSKIKHLLEELATNEENISPEDLRIQSVETICKLMSSSIDFINGMVSHTGRNKSAILASYLCESFPEKSWHCYEILCCRKALINYVFDLLHICVESDIFESAVLSKYRETISLLLKTIFQFISFPELLDYLKREGNDVCNSVGVISFFYLLFIEDFADEDIPLVYQDIYLFTILQPYFHTSLKLSSSHTTKVALHLLSHLLSELQNCFTNFSLSSLQEMATNLTKIMIWSEEEELRKQSQSIFILFLNIVPSESRYILLHDIYKQCDHPGLHGYLIKHISTNIEELFSCEDHKTKVNCGDLALLFTKIIVGENNVLHESDRFIASLNFVRFWLLRDDRDEDRSGIWSKMNELNKNISIMVKCIDVSKKELEEQLYHLASSNANSKDVFHTEILVSLPGGEMFPDLSTNEKTAIANKALLTLDIMSSIIARIDEITSTKEEIDA